MRIGIVCPYDLGAPGGVQQLVTELAAELRLVGEEVVVVGAGYPAPMAGDPPTETVGRAVGIRANDSIAPVTFSPRARGRMQRALADIDVVHIHEPLVPLVGWFALGLDKPRVATFHAAPSSWVPPLYRMLPVASRMRASVMTAVSRTAAAAIPSGWGRIEIIPNAIDTGSYDLPVDRVEGRVCFLGRDEARKGLDVLLEAWPQIRANVPRAELKVMGADRSAPVNGVEFLGRVSGGEKKRILASSLVHAAPNRRGESFGIVIAEGMAAGCAVVASDLAAFRDVAGDNVRFVPAGDPSGLAEMIVSLLQDPEGAVSLGERGREHARLYDWSRVIQQYRRVYQVALGLAAVDDR